MPDLTDLGLTNTGEVYHNLSTPALYEEAIRHREAHLSHLGPLVVRTGHYTGRSADDKFIVRDDLTDGRVDWGARNRAIDAESFERLLVRLGAEPTYTDDDHVRARHEQRPLDGVVGREASIGERGRLDRVEAAEEDEPAGARDEHERRHAAVAPQPATRCPDLGLALAVVLHPQQAAAAVTAHPPTPRSRGRG
jgi:hypothetical protein